MAREKSLKTSIPTLGEMLVRFWPLIRKQRLVISGSFLAMFSEVAFRLAEPWPIKFVFDRVIVNTPAGGSTGVAALDALSPTAMLAVVVVAMIVIAAARAMAGYVRRVGFALAGNNVLTQCRGELFTHLQRLSLSFHSRRRTGDLITRITGDIGQLKEVAITAALPLVGHILTLSAMILVMLLMDWRLGLIALSILPLFVVATRRLGKRIRGVARIQRQRKGEMGATAQEAIGSIKVVQSLSLEAIHAKTFAARNKSDLKEGVKAKRLSARLIGTADVLIAAGTAGVVWFGAGMVVRGELSPGDLFIFLAYVKSALRPVRNVAKYSGRIAKAAASAERILEILDTTPAIRNRPGAVDTPERVTSISFDGVTFGYEPDVTAVEGLEFRAETGDVIALAGPSGAGKSTIVNLLLRLYDPVSGRVTMDGKDIREYTMESVRRRIAVVPQENILFAVSIRDNIAYGAPGATDDEVVAAAQIAQAHEFITALPDGYDTAVGERGETLSEGQRQRIAIARAAIRSASILVLDEPTASLDNENNRLIRSALGELSRDRICFIIAHDLSTVLDNSRVLFLEKGRIVEDGRHEELIRQGGRYAAMYALQHGGGLAPEQGQAHALGG